MKKEKYITFIAIGFELIGLLIISIYGGEWLVKRGSPEYLKALLVVLAFALWFMSLIIKLKNKDKND